MDFERLEVLGEMKRGIFEKMVHLGGVLGLDRSHPLLARRLEALQQAEAMNLEALGHLLEKARGEGQELTQARRNLHTLKGAYLGGESGNQFFAEG